MLLAESDLGDVSLSDNSTVDSLTKQYRYRQALLYNLLLQTSCFRYWGQGAWTDYANEIFRRGEAILQQSFSV